METKIGDRYTLSVECDCGETDDDVLFAPTCGFMTWQCPKCFKIIDLEKYSGIDAEGCANTEEGANAVRRQKQNMRKITPKFPEDYIEIKQSEYKRINKNPNDYWQTARTGFKFFKLKPKDKIITDEFSDLSAEILENGWVTLSQTGRENISLGKYPNARFKVIEKLLEDVKK